MAEQVAGEGKVVKSEYLQRLRARVNRDQALQSVEEELREGLTVHFAEDYEDVFKVAFPHLV